MSITAAAVTVSMKDENALKTQLKNRINRYYIRDALGVASVLLHNPTAAHK